MLNCGEREVKVTKWLTAEQIIAAYERQLAESVSIDIIHSDML